MNIYRRHIICLRHWPPACLQSWVEFNFAGKLAVVGDSRRWKYFIWTSSTVAAFFIKTIRSIFRGKVVENCAIQFAFRANLSMSATHHRCAGDPLGQVPERYQLQPATTTVAGRSAGYENQALSTRVMWRLDMSGISSRGSAWWAWHIHTWINIKFWMNSSSEMRDYYVHSENFTENELIIGHVHESREIT